MTRDEIDLLVKKYESEFNPHSYNTGIQDTQFDDRSAAINYAMVREYKPRVVVEFGTNFGRCTHDILQALLKNDKEYIFNPYEIDNDLRKKSQDSLDRIFQDKSPHIRADVRNDYIPVDIEYLFLDHSHDESMNNWVFDYLLPNHCKKGCIIQIHDLPLSGDWQVRPNPWKEAELIVEKHKAGTLPLEKIYWTYEEGENWESTWWKYL